MLSWIRKSVIRRYVAAFLLVTMLQEIFLPLEVYALTSGPASPEFSSFEPVAATDMVDIFSGDFSYNLPVINIPGPNGSGYPLSLSYHAGASLEQEASWVGYGWTLNPGSLNRDVRGFADDVDGKKIKYYNKVPMNWSLTMGANATLEMYSNDISIGINSSTRYNNYMGISRMIGFGITQKSVGSLGFNYDGNNFTVNGQISVGGLLNGFKKQSNAAAVHSQIEGYKYSYKSETSADCKKEDAKRLLQVHNASMKSSPNAKSAATSVLNSYTGTAGIFSFENTVRQTNLAKYFGFSFNFQANVMIPIFPVALGPKLGIVGNLNLNKNLDEVDSKEVLGYMYTKPYTHNKRTVMRDYTIENDDPYQKRDFFLPIPFNNADIYSITGEGIGGGFRLQHHKIGQLFPDAVESGGLNIGLGLDFIAGNPLGIGIDLGFGGNVSTHGSWPTPAPNYANSTDENEGPESEQYLLNEAYREDCEFNANGHPRDRSFFRFNNDMGGDLNYEKDINKTNNIFSAHFRKPYEPVSPVPGMKVFRPWVDRSFNLDDLNDERKERSYGRNNYIEYYLNSEIETGDADDRYLNTFSRDKEIYNKNMSRKRFANLPTSDNKNISEQIGAYQVTSSGGMRYVYDMPVYNQKEYDLRYGVEIFHGDPNPKFKFGNDGNKQRVYYASQTTNDPDLTTGDYRALSGEERETPYASNYLLTHIFTPDYYDIENNGPGKEDLGGWTRFVYNLEHGGDNDNNWYKWRAPYNGFNFSPGELSSNKDDFAAVNTGLKEVHYLKYIETATHIACFITNNTDKTDFAGLGMSEELTDFFAAVPEEYLRPDESVPGTRPDGYDAGDHPSVENAVKGTHAVEKLCKIVLFSKERAKKPLKTVHFKYSNKLAPGLPNATNGAGKLTLERVWFEYEGVRSVRVSPYIFKYEYKKRADFEPEVVARYSFLGSSGDWPSYVNATDENPAYSHYSTDAWGKYRDAADGRNRADKFMSWVDQSRDNATTFDPAAWQLKQIVLPTGGEILVQYEQDDYQYVQNRRALAMVSLSQANDVTTNSNRYYLNLNDIAVSSAEEDAYKTFLQEYFVNGDQKIFFKFLYSLLNNSPRIDSKSEYIDGYADVKEVGSDGNGVYIVLGKDAAGGIVYPKRACKEFVKTNRGGVGSASIGTFENMDGPISNGGTDGQAIASMVVQTIITPITSIFSNIIDMVTEEATICINMEPSLSYLRVPVYKPKIGGGLRVKRILTYDKGIENGDAQLYGLDYRYHGANGESYGVAANEPAMIHDENALVTFLKRHNQSFFNKLIYGRDRKQVEGPIGESLLPPASVGYSKVVVSNIYKGPTGAGEVEHEFYTAKDYPYDKDYGGSVGKSAQYTELDNESHKGKDYLMIPTGFINYSVNRAWLAQGFKFIMNSMHGQPKGNSTYAIVNGNRTLMSSQKYEYYEPGETIKTIGYSQSAVDPTLNDLQVFTDYYPGREMDVTSNMSATNDFVLDLQFQIDISVLISFTPMVYVSFGGFQLSFNNTGLQTHVTSKVISYPAIMKRTTNYLDGITHIEETLAFDKVTGAPILSKTYDSYDGLTLPNGTTNTTHDGALYSMDIPAHLLYPEMGQKWKDPANNTNQFTDMAGKITSYGKDGNMLSANWFDMTGTPGARGITSASFTTYKKNWNSTNSVTEEVFTDDYGISSFSSKRFYPEKQYAYLTDISKANPLSTSTPFNRAYTGGIMPDFAYYDIGASNPKWQKVSEITAMTPNGQAVEEKNALGIFSMVKYGYNRHMPYLLGQNIQYFGAEFRSFESAEEAGAYTTNLSSNFAHTGKKSYSLPSGSGLLVSSKINLDENIRDNGLLVSLWVKDDNLQDNSINVVVTGGGAVTALPKKVCEVNGWKLIDIPITGFSSTLGTDMSISVSNQSSSAVSYIDDVKIQPLVSSVRCIVYDPLTLRMVAEFGQSHFATVYQYNDEGKLIRKLIETELGIKTVQENQYNTPKTSRAN